MADILIPFGSEFLALTNEQFEEARQRGREIVPASPVTHAAQEDTILDAAGMEAHTGIPASWFLEQARQGKIPHIRAGKYVRFRLNEVLDALAAGLRPGDRLSLRAKMRAADQGVTTGRYHHATGTIGQNRA